MYREDEAARTERANVLIREIADLERQKVAQAAADERLADARRELATLQVAPGPSPAPTAPGLVAHVLVFAATATAAFLGYTFLT